MAAADTGRALDGLSADDAATVLDELPSEKELEATLARMDPSARMAARWSLDRRHLRKVLNLI